MLAKDRAVSVWKTMQNKGATTPPTVLTKSQGVLGENEAVSMAIASNRTLKDLRARLSVSRAAIEVAGQWEDPQLRISEIALDDIVDGKPTMEFALRFPFTQPGSINAKKHATALAHQALKTRFKGSEHEVTIAVKRAFKKLAILDLDIQEVDREIVVRVAHLELVKRRLDAGVSVEVDLALATLPHARALDEKEALVGERASQLFELAKLLGLSTVPRLKLEGDLYDKKTSTPMASSKKLIERALTARPELREAALQLGRAEARAFIAERRRWPWPDFAQINYEIRHPLEPMRYGFALALKIPVFEWAGDRLNLHTAEITLRKVQEESLIREIERQVRDARSRVELLEKRLVNLRETMLPAATASAEAVKRALEAGTLDPLRASVVEGRRIRAKRAYLKVLSRYYDAIYDLEQALGPAL